MEIKETADGSKTLYSSKYQQTFHSDKGAVTESRHVFLGASGVTEKMRHGQEVSVLEIGFGTGLNFFLTADEAINFGEKLNYTALEKDLLEADLVQNLGFASYLQDQEMIGAYLEFRRHLSQPTGNLIFQYKQVTLELYLGEATEQRFIDDTYNAIYQDAFSPDANPELWSKDFSTKLFNTLKSGGRLTTYSVKGDVRRALQEVGFKVEKHPGPPGGKREMLVAIKGLSAEC